MNLADYAEKALTTLEQKALYLGDVDWPALRASTLGAAARADDVAQVHAVLQDVVHRVGGVHSCLMTPGAQAPFRAAAQELPTARVAGEAGDVGVLVLPSCAGSRPASRAYVAAGARALRSLPAVRRWVVDLRRNEGGSMWPMLAVAAPLLGGNGVLGTFTSRGGEQAAWWLMLGWVGSGAFPQARSRGPRRLAGPVAVLTSELTASSGEAVALSFRGLPHVRSYGTPTRGLSTANEVVPLKDGALLVITTATMADRHGVVADGPVPPDVLVEAPEDALDVALAALPQRG